MRDSRAKVHVQQRGLRSAVRRRSDEPRNSQSQRQEFDPTGVGGANAIQAARGNLRLCDSYLRNVTVGCDAKQQAGADDDRRASEN